MTPEDFSPFVAICRFKQLVWQCYGAIIIATKRKFKPIFTFQKTLEILFLVTPDRTSEFRTLLTVIYRVGSSMESIPTKNGT